MNRAAHCVDQGLWPPIWRRVMPWGCNMPIEFNRRAPVRCSLAAAVLATLVAAPGAADARRVASASIGAYDGTWNVVFSTKAGNCSATNSAPFAVS